MDLNKKKKRLFFSLLLLFFFVILFLKVPSKIQIPVKTLPAREWVASKSDNGQISSFEINYLTGKTNHLLDFVADRGEQTQLKIEASLSSGQWIDSNQVVARIHSSDLQQEILQTRQQLRVKQAELKIFTTGEKIEIIRIYENEYQGLLEQLKIEQDILARKETLLKKKLIAPQEYQIQQAKIVELQSEASALKAKIEGLKTGAKQEQIDFIKSQILALNEQLNFLKQQDSILTLRTPFAGWLVFHVQSDTLIHLTNNKKLVGVFLIPLAKNYSSLLGKKVIVNGKLLNQTITGRIIRFAPKATLLKGQNMIYGFIRFDIVDTNLLPNLLLKGQIEIEKKPVWQYVVNFLQSFLNE